MFAPYDPDDRLARVTHRGARPERRPLPDYLTPLGRTVGLPMNGAVSNLPLTPETITRLSHELRTGGFDVLHVHDPNAPLATWYALESARVPVVGTFHTYSAGLIANGFAANIAGARRLYRKLSARIAVSEAARWTAERFYGGGYTPIPHRGGLGPPPPPPPPGPGAPRPTARPGEGPLRLLFVGRAEGRKGLPVLLRAFEALRHSGVEARLTVAGASHAEGEPALLPPDGGAL